MRTWLRSRGLSSATRYHEGLYSSSDIQLKRSGQPRPERKAQPVGEAVGPDPHQPALVDVDLADALHPGPQPGGIAFQARLHAEGVAPLLGDVHGGDARHDEREALLRDRGHGERAAL